VSSTVPLWIAVLLSLIPSVVAVVAIVAAEFRDRRRLKHEREMQLNEARREAYANLSKLTKGMNIENTEAVPEVREAHAQVEILGGNPELLDVADTLVRMWTGAWQSARRAHEEGASPWDAPGYKNLENLLPGLRAAFLDRTREELGVKGRSAGARELEASPPDDALPGPETAASRPWWRRWVGA
jgi:hypothetical protein